jgi:predicted small metal-binding protein
MRAADEDKLMAFVGQVVVDMGALASAPLVVLGAALGAPLTIAGEEEEVLDAATEHAVSAHGHTAGSELREMIRSGLKDEVSV